MPTFCKEERLCDRKHIFSLQKEGQSFFIYPFTIKWMEISDRNTKSIQLLTAVSKRNFKKAVDRNRVKRLIREAYRLNKKNIFASAQQKNKNVVIMLLYTGKKIVPYKEVESKIVLILHQIAESL